MQMLSKRRDEQFTTMRLNAEEIARTIAQTRNGKISRHGQDYTAPCPCHDDDRNSFCISVKPHHKTGVDTLKYVCYAGCSQSALTSALQSMGLIEKEEKKGKWIQVAKYDYCDADGNLKYRVTRQERDGEKKFIQSQLNKGEWRYNMKDVLRLPYKLPELLQAIESQRVIFWVEGEKCADLLMIHGFAATTTSGGAESKFLEDWNQWFNKTSSTFVVIPDCDKPGDKYARRIAGRLISLGNNVRILNLDLPTGEDIVDWFNRGGTKNELINMVHELEPMHEAQQDEIIEEFQEGAVDDYIAQVERYSDDWLARKIAIVAREKLIYTAEDGWHEYKNGRYFASGKAETFRDYVGSELGRTIRKIEGCDTKGAREALKSLTTFRGQNAILQLAKAFMARPLIDFDKNPLELNFANGILNVETMKMQQHSPSILMRHQIDYNYDADATCPLWEAFLKRIFDNNQELIDFIQMSLGYSLTGLTSEQQIWFCYGSGRNGKSKFLETLPVVMGSYATNCRPQMFMRDTRKDPTDNPHHLLGSRFVGVNEVGQNDRLDEQLLKDWTGGEKIYGRFLFAEAFKFKPIGKLWFRGNYKPAASPDEGTWRRMWLIPFEQWINDDERDKDIGEKLILEAPGIMNWMLRGWLAYVENNRTLDAPKIVRDATKEYQNEADPLGAWLNERFVVRANCPGLPITVLYSAYQNFCENNGMQPLARPRFAARLKSAFKIHASKIIDNIYPLEFKEIENKCQE